MLGGIDLTSSEMTLVFSILLISIISLLSEDASSIGCSCCVTSISTKGIPVLALSPTETLIFLTIPSTDAGISIAALSVSRTIIGSSDSTF